MKGNKGLKKLGSSLSTRDHSSQKPICKTQRNIKNFLAIFVAEKMHGDKLEKIVWLNNISKSRENFIFARLVLLSTTLNLKANPWSLGSTGAQSELSHD